MNLKKLILQGESETLEFKESTGEWKEIIKTISAFTNTKGGKIVIGLSNSGKLLGAEVGKDTIEHFTNKVSQNTDPRIHPSITTEKINSKYIVIIEAKESPDHLALAFGRPFKRAGKSTVRMSKDQYERSILDKHKEKLQFDNRIYKGVSIIDIDEEKVKRFLEKAKFERKLEISSNIASEEALEKLNLIKNGKFTNAAILLFGKNPQRFFLQAEVRCARFKGDKPAKPFIDMKVFEGSIIEQVDKTIGFILEHIPMKVYLAGRPEREEKYEYPPDALREAVINAICHRDYASVGHIQIRIFDNRIEIWNPGLVPEPLTLEDLKKKHKSIPRNPLIAKCFFLIKFIEQWGTGTNDMINMCLDWGLSAPLFEHITGDFVVTFRGNTLTEERMEKLDLNARQKKAIDYIREHNKITRIEYAKLNKVSNATAKRDLKILVDKGVLKTQGKGPETSYILSRYEPI